MEKLLKWIISECPSLCPDEGGIVPILYYREIHVDSICQVIMKRFIFFLGFARSKYSLFSLKNEFEVAVFG